MNHGACIISLVIDLKFEEKGKIVFSIILVYLHVLHLYISPKERKLDSTTKEFINNTICCNLTPDKAKQLTC